jgi:hypothetical protein
MFSAVRSSPRQYLLVLVSGKSCAASSDDIQRGARSFTFTSTMHRPGSRKVLHGPVRSPSRSWPRAVRLVSKVTLRPWSYTVPANARLM